MYHEPFRPDAMTWWVIVLVGGDGYRFLNSVCATNIDDACGSASESFPEHKIVRIMPFKKKTDHKK